MQRLIQKIVAFVDHRIPVIAPGVATHRVDANEAIPEVIGEIFCLLDSGADDRSAARTNYEVIHG